MKNKVLVALVATVMVTGCASGDYIRYVDSQKEIGVAQANAEAEKYKAMAAIAVSGDSTAKVAALFALHGGASAAPQQLQVQAPKSAWEQAKEWTGLVLPTVVQAYGINANKAIAVTQSNNSRDVAVSTNSTFASMNANGMTAVANVSASGNTALTTVSANAVDSVVAVSKMIQAPAANITTTTTNTNTLSGTGNLGSGSYANSTNTNTLSGTGAMGSGGYSTTDNHTTTTDNHAVDNHASSSSTNPTVTTQVPAGQICIVDGTGALVCH